MAKLFLVMYVVLGKPYMPRPVFERCPVRPSRMVVGQDLELPSDNVMCIVHL